MLKKLIIQSAKILAVLALAVGTISGQVACSGAYYQPKMPEKMKK